MYTKVSWNKIKQMNEFWRCLPALSSTWDSVFTFEIRKCYTKVYTKVYTSVYTCIHLYTLLYTLLYNIFIFKCKCIQKCLENLVFLGFFFFFKSSKAVTHPTISRAQPCLTSLISWRAFYSRWYRCIYKIYNIYVLLHLNFCKFS